MTISKLKTSVFLFIIGAVISAHSHSETAAATPRLAPSTELSVHKNPNCGCCGVWIEHAQQHGFTTTVQNHVNLNALKAELGIPTGLQACHTSVSSDGFVFEGHIPARYITQFLADKPSGARGLIVANMPMGSPGMDMGRGFQPYDILLLLDNGNTEVYATINSKAQQ
ncbi:DUF411 domain-containing protein [Zhongshania sp.]|uniref:DUF411 domain-containing protein n=1 Tax=Zhongshania sp. TaxID=1971902 RepID=UPI003566FB5F